MPNKLVELIDAEVVANAEDEFRKHLGGSLIGRKCDRQLWYSFRWAASEQFEGRMLRLFDRGHREEFRFVAYLRSVGATVYEFSERLAWDEQLDDYIIGSWFEPLARSLIDVTDSEYHRTVAKEQRGIAPKQWRIVDVDGHFGGSLDTIATGVPGFEEFDLSEAVLGEFKTHNTKSFTKLTLECETAVARGEPESAGLYRAKPEHFIQMQIYMHKRSLKWGFYMAVNKDNEHLKAIAVQYDPLIAPQYIERARRIIHAKQPPARVSNTPSFFDCKFCAMNGVCWQGKAMNKNCRTCVHSAPVADGEWHCALAARLIPSDVMSVGCDSYKTITD